MIVKAPLRCIRTGEGWGGGTEEDKKRLIAGFVGTETARSGKRESNMKKAKEALEGIRKTRQ